MSLPDVLSRADPPVVRARDFAHVWARPEAAMARAVEDGTLLRLAHGLYVVVPLRQRGRSGWRPSVEEVALGVGTRRFDADHAALMHLSAARVLDAWPRRRATAVVAVPSQRAALETLAGRVVFVARDTDRLDARRVVVGATTGLATDVEQTILDLLDRPMLAGSTEADAAAAARALAGRADRDRLVEVAERLRKTSALELAVSLLDEVG